MLATRACLTTSSLGIVHAYREAAARLISRRTCRPYCGHPRPDRSGEFSDITRSRAPEATRASFRRFRPLTALMTTAA